MNGETLKELFTVWRKKNAPDEENLLSTAIEINQYVEKIDSIDLIKHDFKDATSPYYRSFCTQNKKPFLGAILYARIALQDYLNEVGQTTAESQTLIQALDTLYCSSVSKLNENLCDLVNKLEQWLTHKTDNAEKTQKLYLALYTALQIANIKLNKNKDRFRELFNTWRKDEAPSEENLLATAEAIGKYINSVEDIEAIEADLADKNSPKYKEFNTYGKKRSMGTVLHFKLATEDYLSELTDPTSPEATIVSNLTQTLADIYKSPLQNSSANLKSLVENVKAWLNIQPYTNPDKAHNLCRSLYAALKMADIKLKGLHGMHKGFASLKNIDLGQTKLIIDELLEQTAEKATELQGQLTGPKEPPVSSPTLDFKKITGLLAKLEAETQKLNSRPVKALPKTAAEYFNKEFITLLESDGSEVQKLRELEKLLTTVNSHILKLIDEKEKQAKVEEEIKAVQDLFIAAKTNEQKVIGRLYFVEIIKEYQKGYDFLLATEQGKAFAEQAKVLTEPGLGQQLTSAVQYTASWLTSITTTIYRAVTPQSIQDTIKNYTPDTLDSEYKEKLRVLAFKHLEGLPEKLNAAKLNVDKEIDSFANEQPQLKLLLAKSTIPELQNLYQTNIAVRSTIAEYYALTTFIKDKQQKLNAIKGLDLQIDEFIKQHNGFLVKLSNLFARILSIFKSKTAKMIDRAREVKKELQEFKENYNTALELACVDFKESKIAKPIREILSRNVDACLSEEIPDAPKVQSTEKLKAPTAFQQIQTTFSKIKKVPASIEPVMENNLTL
ncbi:hypothetical protein [Legionella cardiaca]|uniref:Purine NTPase n=1 Tax=Legionella cardiaca TaxID=1071983 RepID=A0ABY8AV32_9GAMM|nr:hypothetical protein [Legionella cardiaca]WED43606.1 hypothetical protein PXX05_02185 [Legionella cardiaca]